MEACNSVIVQLHWLSVDANLEILCDCAVLADLLCVGTHPLLLYICVWLLTYLVELVKNSEFFLTVTVGPSIGRVHLFISHVVDSFTVCLNA